MSSTFTIRVPRELKERMKRFRVEWSEEIRRFIEGQIKRLELIEVVEDVWLRAERRPVRVDSTVLIREDRGR